MSCDAIGVYCGFECVTPTAEHHNSIMGNLSALSAALYATGGISCVTSIVVLFIPALVVAEFGKDATRVAVLALVAFRMLCGLVWCHCALDPYNANLYRVSLLAAALQCALYVGAIFVDGIMPLSGVGGVSLA